MIQAGAISTAAATDGDVLTRAVLASLRPKSDPQGTFPGAVLAAPPPATPEAAGSPGRAPSELTRPAQCSRQVRDAAWAWLASRARDRAPDGQVSDPATAQPEELLLHQVETSRLTRPPATATASRLDAELAAIYLSLARHWISYARHQHDPRFLNAALKLCAAALLAPIPATALSRDTLRDALDALDDVAAPSHAEPDDDPHPDRLHTLQRIERPSGSRATTRTVQITVLAGAGSSGLPMFLAATAEAGLRVGKVILHEPASSGPPPGSAYASAWYPNGGERTSADDAAASSGRAGQQAAPLPRPMIMHGDWTAVSQAVRDAGTDLLVLLGMDVVPACVLDVPRLGTINAHNGALPAYRGMDAVAWAVLAGDPVLCSVHVVTPDVDAGDVLAEAAVLSGTGQQTHAPPHDLRRRVKQAQIALLTQVALDATSNGALPAGRAQTGTARRYYRMHPSLRRVLDARLTAVIEEARA